MTPHSWDVTPAEARELQSRLRGLVARKNRFGTLETVAGADISLDRASGTGHAGIILYTFPGLEEVERACASGPLRFPYVPGLLSFREGPLLMEAFSRLSRLPDLVLFDGQGLAHPRRFGLACHLSVLLDRPGIGVAKSLFVGQHEQPPTEAGSHVPLVDGGEVIGAAVRCRRGVRPIYVSIGHRVDLPTAIELTLRCADGYRLPRPTREADRYAGRLRRG